MEKKLKFGKALEIWKKNWEFGKQILNLENILKSRKRFENLEKDRNFEEKNGNLRT